VVVAIITQQDVRDPIKCPTIDKSQSQSLNTWIHCCVHLSSLLGVGEQWCWCKYVYLLYAASVYDKGDQEFVTLSDKSALVGELLSLCGWKINKLMNEMEPSKMASLMAHLSPNILQWIKKQVLCTYVATYTYVNMHEVS